jgi:hypothetical protein
MVGGGKKHAAAATNEMKESSMDGRLSEVSRWIITRFTNTAMLPKRKIQCWHDGWLDHNEGNARKI